MRMEELLTIVRRCLERTGSAIERDGKKASNWGSHTEVAGLELLLERHGGG